MITFITICLSPKLCCCISHRMHRLHCRTSSGLCGPWGRGKNAKQVRAKRREEHGRHGGQRPLVMEVYVQQHDDVSMINAKSKRRSDRSQHCRRQAPLPHPACLPLIRPSPHLTSPHFISSFLYSTLSRIPSSTHHQKPKIRVTNTNPIHSYPKRTPSSSHTSPQEIKKWPRTSKSSASSAP